MKPKLIFNSRLVPPGYEAIMLYPFILFSQSKTNTNNRTITHEVCHFEQARINGPLFFYLNYLWQFLVGLFKTRSWDKAYYLVGWEVEAMYVEDNYTLRSYLDVRYRYDRGLRDYILNQTI